MILKGGIDATSGPALRLYRWISVHLNGIKLRINNSLIIINRRFITHT